MTTSADSRASNSRHNIVMTAMGSGLFSLFFPGMMIAALADHQLLLAVGVGAGLLLGTNLVLARIAVGRIGLRLRAPSTATIGREVTLSVITFGGPLDCRIRVEGLSATDTTATPWRVASAPGDARVVVPVEKRGTIEGFAVRLESMVPFGLVGVTRRTVVALDEPLYAAPAAVADVLVSSTSSSEASQASIGGGSDGEPSGFRPMVPGDRQRDIHWPTVARTGHVLVRDRPAPDRTDTINVAVLVGEDPVTADETIGRARWAVEQLQQTGKEVRLVTLQRDSGSRSSPEVVMAVVGTAQGLFRRLSGISPGTPDEHRLLLSHAGPGLRVTEGGIVWHHPS